jgi:hypothetical protein
VFVIQKVPQQQTIKEKENNKMKKTKKKLLSFAI